MFSCEERGEEEVEGVVQTRERRGDWGLVRGACLLARGAKVQNTNHWLEVGAAFAGRGALTNHHLRQAPQNIRGASISKLMEGCEPTQTCLEGRRIVLNSF